jgi:hypothetical protein
LAFSAGTLSPAFASASTSYTANVINSVESVTVAPTVMDGNATVKVNGTAVTSGSASEAIPLAVGSNTITVLVTAQDGTTTKTYTVAFIREAKPDSDGDGLSDEKERELGIDPNRADSDADGLSDAIEVSMGLNPLIIDTDSDGFSDHREVMEMRTNPMAFTVGITSDLKETTIPRGKLMPRYVTTNNFGAKEYTARGLPPGMKINKNTGVISGKTKKKGTYNVTITATKRDKKKKILQSVQVVKVFKVN